MHPLILAALQLPADTEWPPDAAALLGVPPGASVAEVEAAVMERSAALRQYQLVYPQEVTEALNRLAAAYGAHAAPPAPTPPPLPQVVPAPDLFELVEDEPSAVRPMVITPPAPPLTPRRRLYRDLVRARRLLKHWDAAGELLAHADLAAMTRVEWIRVVAALRQLETALPEEGPGGAVVALARGRPGLVTLSELSFARRELLRDDWRDGRAVLFERLQESRRAVTRPRWRAGRVAPRRRATTTQISAALVAFIVVARWYWSG
jgi:hypothetical protein